MKNRDLMKLKLENDRGKLSISLYFAFIVAAELAVAVGVSYGIAVIFRYIPGPTAAFPSSFWMIIFSLVIGLVFAFFLNRLFFKPIKKLSEAMKNVAAGDFKVRLDSKNVTHEVQDIYANFNLMTKELEATEILQTDFISNVSHEIKTPISAVEGYAMLLQDPDCTKDEQKQYIEKILFNTNRLSELVGNILLLSRLESQAIETAKTHFRMDEQIRRSIMLLEPKWEAKNIEFDVELDDVEFFGNDGLTFHIWNNIIGNAIKFSANDGKIKLKLYTEQDKAIFSCEDEGCGIPEEAMTHIFNKFYQCDSSRKSDGNGLGLALVKRIIDIHSGKVLVQNLEEKGCRFTVVLPLNNEK